MKKVFKKKLLVVILVGSTFSLALIFYFNFEGPIQISSASFNEQKKENLPSELANSSLPIRLKIPSIKVDSAVKYVGLTSDGAMGVTKGPSDIAWFDLGPLPGEKGSAVMAGHSGWKNGIPAAFDNLYKLKKGDKIYVEDEKGVITTFVVRESKTYGWNKDAPDVFISNDGKAHLNLVTCTGLWNKILKSHSDRLIVFTDKEI